MTRVGFETTVPGSALAKTVHALDRSATVTGTRHITASKYSAIANLHNLQLTVTHKHYVLSLLYSTLVISW
jgi:hypothetical protein